MIEKNGFILGKILAFVTSWPRNLFILLGLLIAGSFWFYKAIQQSIKPPDECDCALNALMVNTTYFDSLLQKKCNAYEVKLTTKEKGERAIRPFECPKVKAEIDRQEKKKTEQEAERLKQETERIFRQNCNSEAARNFVKNRFRDIGTVIVDDPVLVESDNSNCYYGFSVIVQKELSVVGCDIAVKYEDKKFKVKYVNCQ